MSEELVDQLISQVESKHLLFKTFLAGVITVFNEDKQLHGHPPLIHSVRSRLKEPSHLREKLVRKISMGRQIDETNIFQQITDIAGVRVMHLHLKQFTGIHECIMRQVAEGDWILHEPPKAYTWDPESRDFFEKHGLTVEVKESFYTSIHYVVRPRPDSPVSCEIQVRTLFEEIWGEIDHLINYPSPTVNISCKEQLRALARLVGAGSRLADSIFATFENDR